MIFWLLNISQNCFFCQNRLLHGTYEEYMPDSNFAELNDEISQNLSLVYEGIAADEQFLLSHQPSYIFGISTAEKHARLYAIKLNRFT